MMLPPPCFTIGMVPGFLQTWCLAFKPKSSILVSSDQRILELCHEWPSGSWSPRLLSLARRPALGRGLHHFRMMEATVFLGTFNVETNFFWYLSPDLCLDTILSRSSTDNSFNLMAWFLLWYSLSTVGPYIDRCAPFQIMSNQFNLDSK
jgi:hypothetical protein